MKKFEVPLLDIETNPIFKGIPDDEYDEIIEKLDQKLDDAMLDNTIVEIESIQCAKEFHCSSFATRPRMLINTPKSSKNHDKNK